MSKSDLTKKEKEFIAEFKQLARKWPKTLWFSGDDMRKNTFVIYKQQEPGLYTERAVIRGIKNMDEW